MRTTNIYTQEYRNTTYKNGKFQGRLLGWYDNDQLFWYKEFKNGKRHGKYIWYSKKGTVWYDYTYINGIKQ